MTPTSSCDKNPKTVYNLAGLSAYLEEITNQSGGYLPADEALGEAAVLVNAAGQDLFLNCAEMQTLTGNGDNPSREVGALLDRERYKEFLNPLTPEKLFLRTTKLLSRFQETLNGLLPNSVKQSAQILQSAYEKNQNLEQILKESWIHEMGKLVEPWKQFFKASKPVYWMDQESPSMAIPQEIALMLPGILSGRLRMDEIRSFFFRLMVRQGISNPWLKQSIHELFSDSNISLASFNRLLTKMERMEAGETSRCTGCVISILVAASSILLHTVGSAHGQGDVHTIFPRFVSKVPANQQDDLSLGITHVGLKKEPCELKVIEASAEKPESDRLVQWKDVSSQMGTLLQRAQVRNKGLHDVRKTNYIRVTVDGEQYYVQSIVVKDFLMASIENYLQFTKLLNEKILKRINGMIILSLLATAYFCYQCATKK